MSSSEEEFAPRKRARVIPFLIEYVVDEAVYEKDNRGYDEDPAKS